MNDPHIIVRVDRHADRLAEIEGILSKNPGISCWNITLALPWSRPWDDIHSYMQRAANGETLAHLILLEDLGRLRRVKGIPDRWYVDGR